MEQQIKTFKIAPVWRDDWSRTEVYDIGDECRDPSTGSVIRSLIKANVGNDPSDTSAWKVIVDLTEQHRIQEHMAKLDREITANEHDRVDAEAKRQDNEAARTSAEADRKEMEYERILSEVDRGRNETERQQAEQVRVDTENLRKDNETARQDAETARNNAEVARYNTFLGWSNTETQRNQAEQARISAEQERAAAEAQRVTSESARQQAEGQRATTFSSQMQVVDTALTDIRKATDDAVKATGAAETATADSVAQTKFAKQAAEAAKAAAEAASQYGSSPTARPAGISVECPSEVTVGSGFDAVSTLYPLVSNQSVVVQATGACSSLITGSVSANTEGDAKIIVMSTISSRVWLAVDVHVRQTEQLIMPDGTPVTDGSGNAFEI